MVKKSFDQWMAEVDKELKALCYMSSSDLPDCPYYDWYNDRVSPKSAAKRAFKNANE